MNALRKLSLAAAVAGLVGLPLVSSAADVDKDVTHDFKAESKIDDTGRQESKQETKVGVSKDANQGQGSLQGQGQGLNPGMSGTSPGMSGSLESHGAGDAGMIDQDRAGLSDRDTGIADQDHAGLADQDDLSETGEVAVEDDDDRSFLDRVFGRD
jgi:hypothetical protein